MADYYGALIGYLESYRPDLYEELIKSGSVWDWLDEHLEQLGKTEDIIASILASEYPDLSSTQIRLQAEEEAIRHVLPVPEEEEMSRGS